jgi:hypothetical protein
VESQTSALASRSVNDSNGVCKRHASKTLTSPSPQTANRLSSVGSQAMPWAFTFTLVEFATVLLRLKKRSQRVEVPARRRCEEGRKERQETSSEVTCCWRMRQHD